MTTPCPFCGGAVRDGVCTTCDRDPTAPRRPCKQCGQMTPNAEIACCHCGTPYRSEMRWKIPLIIALFLLAIVLSVLIQAWTG